MYRREHDQKNPTRAEALQQTFQVLFESAPGLFLVLEPEEPYRIVAASDAYLKATMTKREQIQGKGLFELFPDDPDDPAATGAHNLRASLERVRELKRTDVMAIQYYPIRRPDGTFVKRWWSPSDTPVFGSNGELVYIIHRVEDVTSLIEAMEAQHKETAAMRYGTNPEIRLAAEVVMRGQELQRVNEQLRESEEQLKAASKAKDQFLAVLSHELRTPLTPVLAAISLLQLNGEKFDLETREQLEILRRNVEIEARLIDDLLDITGIVRGKVQLERRVVSLQDVIRRAVGVCRPDVEARDLHLMMRLEECDSIMVYADAARLQQVFWNLLKNAIKFTPRDGRISIQCRNDGNGQAVVEVVDNGEGIDPSQLHCVFNAFEQCGRSPSRQMGGLGLGLTIARGLVEMHGGSIEAHSAGRGKGATFRVRLPTVDNVSMPKAGAGAAQKQSIRSERALHILLVEDHADTARVMKRLLSAAGHQVETAEDVAAALRRTRDDSFDLIVSDLGLPDGSGIDFVQELRRRGQQIPSIALSGFGQDADIQKSLEAGFAMHLTKPVSMERLMEAVGEVSQRLHHVGA